MASSTFFLAWVLCCACQRTAAWTLRGAIISADAATKRSLTFEHEGGAVCYNAACVYSGWRNKQVHVSQAHITGTQERARASCKLPPNYKNAKYVQLRCYDGMQTRKQRLHIYNKLQVAGVYRGATCDGSFCNVFMKLSIDLPQGVLRKAAWGVKCKNDEWVQLEAWQQATADKGQTVLLLEFGVASTNAEGCSLVMNRALMQPVLLPDQDLQRLPVLSTVKG